MLRADMDALPVREETGLDYASEVVATDARGELADAAETEPVMGSEDFGLFGTAAGVPSVFWGIGGSSRDAPGNHSPKFAPRIEPTLSAGVAALVAAGMACARP